MKALTDTGPLVGYLNRSDQERKYADQPMSLAEACLVRTAELTDRCQVFTTDRDFLVYRRKGRHVIPLLSPFAG